MEVMEQREVRNMIFEALGTLGVVEALLEKKEMDSQIDVNMMMALRAVARNLERSEKKLGKIIRRTERLEYRR